METTIMALSIEPRNVHAPEVQNILTKYGCIIKTRLGLHEVASDSCSQTGLILLHICSDPSEIKALEKDLLQVKGVSVKHMTL
jgi:hypothetical protein